MTNITWNIEQLSCYPEVDNYVDVVFSAAWRVNGELEQDGQTYYATVYGSQGLSPYDAKTPFTPYEDLQLAQVTGWVQDAMGDSQVAAINANIEKQIQDQITPTVVTPPLPWATV
jgi:hypothetical protein